MAYQRLKVNARSLPVWAGDFGGREHIVPFPAKVDRAQFVDESGVLVQVTAAAAQGDTSISVAALGSSYILPFGATAPNTPLIPAGGVVYLGPDKFARLTADADINDTTLTVEALPTALTGAEAGRYTRFGVEAILGGTVVGRTLAERASNTPFGPAVSTDDEIYLVLFDNPDLHLTDDIELYRHNSIVKENFLPDYTTILAPGGVDSALMTALRSRYTCIIGVN